MLGLSDQVKTFERRTSIKILEKKCFSDYLIFFRANINNL